VRPRPWFLLLASLAALAALIPADAARAGAIITAYSQDVITGIGLKPGLANNFNLTSTDSSSTDLAELDSAGKVTNTDKLDPKFAAVGPNAGAAQENTFVIIGPHVAKSDAVINANLTAASNDALVNLEKFDTGTAFATNDLQAFFTLKNADSLTLSFTAAVLLQAFIDKTVQNGSAEASLTVNIDITERFGNFNQVFLWTPDGGTGNGITGGVENADPFDLNKTLSLVVPGNTTYQPNNGNAAAFSATTDMLAAGDYKIDFFMSENAFGQAVPEPSTLVTATLGVPIFLIYWWRFVRGATAAKG
jgi:hypothetical protein